MFFLGKKTEAKQLFNTDRNFISQSVKLLISQVADRPKVFLCHKQAKIVQDDFSGHCLHRNPNYITMLQYQILNR